MKFSIFEVPNEGIYNIDVTTVFNTFEAIGNTTSRVEKEKLLKECRSPKMLKRLLSYTYNPFLMFNIKKGPIVTGVKTSDLVSNYLLFNDLLSDLHNRFITGNEAVQAVKNFFSGCTESEYKWYLKVMQKDLKIGITDKTVNKVFPKLIPTFGCELAFSYKDHPSLPKRMIFQRKLDGYRCLAFHRLDGGVTLFSRNGKVLSGYDGVEQDIKNLTSPGFVS